MGITFRETLSGLAAVKPVVGELTLWCDASSVRLCGRVNTLVRMDCDRCLRPYFQSLLVDIDERFVERTLAEAPRERELKRDDFVEPLPADGILDIDDIVYQAVTLATPAYGLCGPDCPGPPGLEKGEEKALPPEGGGDPRWQNLKTLFPNSETGTD